MGSVHVLFEHLQLQLELELEHDHGLYIHTTERRQ
jgi:hypothetical protein